MSNKQIRKMMEFDYNQLKQERVYREHNQMMPEATYEDGTNSLMVKFEESFAVEDEHFERGHDWIENLDDMELLAKIKTLSDEQLELMTSLAFKEITQRKMAEIAGVSPAAISKRWLIFVLSQRLHSERANNAHQAFRKRRAKEIVRLSFRDL